MNTSTSALNQKVLGPTRIDYLSKPRPENFEEIVKARSIRTAPDPLAFTKSLYKQGGR